MIYRYLDLELPGRGTWEPLRRILTEPTLLHGASRSADSSIIGFVGLRGPKYPIFEAAGPKYHKGYGLRNKSPQIGVLGPSGGATLQETPSTPKPARGLGGLSRLFQTRLV